LAIADIAAKYSVNQAGGRVRHASGGAETGFATERDDAIVAAGVASKAQKTSDELAALRQRFQCSLNEGRDGLSMGVVTGALQKLSERVANEFGNDARVGVAGRDVVGGIVVEVVHDPSALQ
jgi:hypothetical protein